MRWIFLAGLVACGPERAKQEYVFASEYLKVRAGGETSHLGDYIVVHGKSRLDRDQAGDVSPYDPVLIAAEWQDLDGDGVRDFESSVERLDDGRYRLHRDFDQDGVSDEVETWNAHALLVRNEGPDFFEEWIADDQDRLLEIHSTTAPPVGDPVVFEQIFTYQGSAPDWSSTVVTYAGQETHGLQELNADGLWVRRLQGDPGEEVEIARRTVDADGRTLRLVETDGFGIETMTTTTRDEYGGILTEEQKVNGGLQWRLEYVRDERGEWTQSRLDADGDGSFEIVDTQTYELGDYDRVMAAAVLRNGEPWSSFETTFLGTVDEVDLDPHGIEPVDFGW